MKWISVKDRLPEPNTYVLVYQGDVVTLSFLFQRRDKSYKWSGETGLGGDVTHWAPLPEGPIEEKI